MLGVGPGSLFWNDTEKADFLSNVPVLHTYEDVITAPRAVPFSLKSLNFTLDSYTLSHMVTCCSGRDGSSSVLSMSTVLLFLVSVAGTCGSDRWREPPSSKPCFLFAPAQTSTRPAKRALCTVQGLRGKAYMLVWEKCCEGDYVWWALTVLDLFVLRNWPGRRRSLFYSWEYLIRVACAFLQGGVLKD